ncbi:MAG: hypothetical protein QF767_08780 [Alphaproteobacteria bacterium]|jgi:hypothetical protein|nr:hypothetical protein [Alphaproteobacteria bacterium]
MKYASNHAMQRIQRVKAAPKMSADERAQAVQDFIDSGQVTHITTADVIAYHDEMNHRHSLIPVAIRLI